MLNANRSTSRHGARWAGIGLGLLFGTGAALAAVPTVVNYQGRLTDNTAQQNPVDATLPMDFSIWDAATGGASLWGETQSIQVVNGLFNVLLGSTTPIAPTVFTGGATRYLEIHVSGETLTPRQRIGAIPFANAAAGADDAAALGGIGAAAYQRRIASACPAGTTINAVAADGTVTCVAGAPGPQGPPGPAGAGLDTGAVSGTATVCGAPAEGTLVYVPGRSAVSYTGADGSYDLSYLPAGTYDVKLVSVGGFHASLSGVVVANGQTTGVGPTLVQDISGNVSHCGACNAACSTNNITRLCTAGSCEGGFCNSGFADCNANKRADGCEADLRSSVDNCGGCGLACSSNNIPIPICGGAGHCTGNCANGFADCNNNKQVDGCEVNITNSNSNCGACGLACGGATPTCVGGVCS